MTHDEMYDFIANNKSKKYLTEDEKNILTQAYFDRYKCNICLGEKSNIDKITICKVSHYAREYNTLDEFITSVFKIWDCEYFFIEECI